MNRRGLVLALVILAVTAGVALACYDLSVRGHCWSCVLSRSGFEECTVTWGGSELPCPSGAQGAGSCGQDNGDWRSGDWWIFELFIPTGPVRYVHAPMDPILLIKTLPADQPVGVAMAFGSSRGVHARFGYGGECMDASVTTNPGGWQHFDASLEDWNGGELTENEFTIHVPSGTWLVQAMRADRNDAEPYQARIDEALAGRTIVPGRTCP